MTIRELAKNLIEHADETPNTISLDRAAEIIGWLDPNSDLPEDLTPEAFMESFNDIIISNRSHIIFNGKKLTAEELLDVVADPEAGISWDTIVNYMDDDIREYVHEDVAPCSELDFLNRYLEVSPHDLIIN